MATFYPNEKVPLKSGGRKSDKITAEEFKNLIKSIFEKTKKKDPELDDYDWDDYSWIFYFNEYLPGFSKDLKYDFDFENTVVQGEVKFTKGGTPYLEFICGGDWEDGLLLYLYPCDGNLRVYIPTKGNTVRKDLKCVFGSELELGDPYLEDSGSFSFSDSDRVKYLNKYSDTPFKDGDIIEMNRDWCLEDFETRLGER